MRESFLGSVADKSGRNTFRRVGPSFESSTFSSHGSTQEESLADGAPQWREAVLAGLSVSRGVNRYPKFWNSDSNRQPTRNSVGHQQIYRTDFGTTPKDLTSPVINLHYYFRVVLKTLSCSVSLVL